MGQAEDYDDWCREHFRRIADGGTWALPGSGLIFVKKGGALVLRARMPHHAAMPMDAAELRARQDHVFDQTQMQFARVGIEVRDGT